jgi:hypothetical protein
MASSLSSTHPTTPTSSSAMDLILSIMEVLVRRGSLTLEGQIRLQEGRSSRQVVSRISRTHRGG